MFKLMMIPVDLRHTDQLQKALDLSADIAKHYDVPVCYVGVAGDVPTSIAHNAAEFEQKFRAFADEQAAKHGIKADCKVFIGHDLVTDVDDVLLKAVDEIGADLVVMASHVPTITDYIWPSNGGKIAAHTKASVFIVRN